MSKVTESIFDGETLIIPLADVAYIQRDTRPNYSDAIYVVLNGSTFNPVVADWNNAPWLRGKEAEEFKKSWCRYRHELESPEDISPAEMFAGTLEKLEGLNVTR